jgi:Domain of unknown function (DUF1850)
MTPLHLVLATSDSEFRFPVGAEDEMRLRFNHSIYGSLVEEMFAVRADGFETGQLRYEEPRLAEYYGYEHAVRCGEWWVVDAGRRMLPEIVLRVTPQSQMHLSVGNVALDLTAMVPPNGFIRASVAQGAET